MILTLREYEDAHLDAPPLSPAARRLAQALTEQGRLTILELREGLRVTATQFVGTVHLDDLAIVVLPKVTPEVMSTFVAYALDLKAIHLLGESTSPYSQAGIIDLLARLVVIETDHLLARGLAQDYRQHDRSLPGPRGKLLVSALARQGPASLTVPCRLFSRTPATLLNQTLVATLSALRPLVKDGRLRHDLHAREALLEEVCGQATLSRSLLLDARQALDRRTAYYSPAVDLAEMVLDALGPTFDPRARHDRSVAFMLDMNNLFERFIERLCRQYAPRDLVILPQDPNRQAYRYASNPHGWQRPTLRPDILVRSARTQAPVIIIDAKYKRLDGSRPSPQDMYQLTLYAMAYGWPPVHARIVYPSTTSHSASPVLEFVGFDRRVAAARVSIHGLDLATCAAHLRSSDHRELATQVSELLNPHGRTSATLA